VFILCESIVKRSKDDDRIREELEGKKEKKWVGQKK
jgi:hypothetical protein